MSLPQTLSDLICLRAEGAIKKLPSKTWVVKDGYPFWATWGPPWKAVRQGVHILDPTASGLPSKRRRGHSCFALQLLPQGKPTQLLPSIITKTGVFLFGRDPECFKNAKGEGTGTFGHGSKSTSYREHPNPTTKTGSLTWVVNSPTSQPKWDPKTVFNHHSHLRALSHLQRCCLRTLHGLFARTSRAMRPVLEGTLSQATILKAPGHGRLCFRLGIPLVRSRETKRKTTIWGGVP